MQFKINFSTAKAIVNTYVKEGRIHRPLRRRNQKPNDARRHDSERT